MNQAHQQNSGISANIQSAGSVPDFIDPIQQLRHIWRYKLQVFAFVVIAALICLFMVFSITPTYRATATLLIQPKTANIVKIDEVYDSNIPTDEYRKTQFEVLKSRKLAERVIRNTDLASYPEYYPPKEEEADSRLIFFLDKIQILLAEYGLPGQQQDDLVGKPISNDSELWRVNKLMSSLNVEPVLKTHLVRVQVAAQNPKLSALLTNNFVNAYIQSEIESRLGLTEQASGWLTSRLTELKAELEESERELQKFYESQELVNMGGARGILEDDLSDNSRRLRDARKTKTDLQNVYRKIISSNSNLESMQEIPAIQRDPLVQSTKRSYLSAGEAVSELQSRYGKKHPKMISAQARLDEAKEAYFRQLRLATDGIKSEYEIASNTEAAIESVVDKSRSQMQKLDRKQYQIRTLEREVETNRKLFDVFLTRFKETDISGNLEVSSARVLDNAIVPTRPYKPRKKLWMATAIMLGLFLGSALALVRGYLDDRIMDSSDLERVTGIPVLSVLPMVKAFVNKAQQMARVEVDAPNSVFAEGIRTIRTALQLADGSGPNKKIMITSSVPSEGKTSVAENLSAAFAQMERVLLIEGDMRKPSLAKYLDLPKGIHGIEEALTGIVPAQDCIHRLAYSNVDVLACINAPNNASELLGSEAFALLLAAVEKNYDRIIIDSPPCQAVSDALVIGRQVDSVLFLAKADSTHTRLIANSLKQLRYANLPVLGAILNQADMKKRGLYGTGYYYYQDYYQSSKSA